MDSTSSPCKLHSPYKFQEVRRPDSPWTGTYARRNDAKCLLIVVFEALALFVADLNDCTNRSANPLVAGCNGAERMCLIVILVRNEVNSLDVNWAPLSETICCGSPNRANMSRSASIVEALVANFIETSSGHLLNIVKHREHSDS